MAEVAIEAEFEAAAELIKTYEGKMDDDTKLELYGLYKQAKFGDVNTSRPGMFDFTGKSKWDAWSKVKGLSQEEAMKNYIAVVNRLMKK